MSKRGVYVKQYKSKRNSCLSNSKLGFEIRTIRSRHFLIVGGLNILSWEFGLVFFADDLFRLGVYWDIQEIHSFLPQIVCLIIKFWRFKVQSYSKNILAIYRILLQWQNHTAATYQNFPLVLYTIEFYFFHENRLCKYRLIMHFHIHLFIHNWYECFVENVRTDLSSISKYILLIIQSLKLL